MATNASNDDMANFDYNVLIITDSRGRNLLPQLNKHQFIGFKINFKVLSFPGATIESILKRIERSSRTQSWDLYIIIAGICNLTHRVVTKGHRFLEYKNRKVEECIGAVDQVFDSVLKDNLHICTFTPASLHKYSNYRNDDPSIKEEQDNLLQDLERINNHIKKRNISADRATIDLAKQTYSLSLKKQGSRHKRVTKFTDKELPDGVHPSIKLEKTWAKYIAHMTVQIIRKRLQPADDPTDESDDSDHGNFKCQKRD